MNVPPLWTTAPLPNTPIWVFPLLVLPGIEPVETAVVNVPPLSRSVPVEPAELPRYVAPDTTLPASSW